MDPEQEMIDEGRRRTPADLTGRLRWIRSRAEDLSADDAGFHLVTIGEAFHRMDQRVVAKHALRWLVPGGCLAILWYEHIWDGAEEWKRRVSEVLARYKKARAAASTGERAPQQFMTFEQVLSATGFQSVQGHEFREPRFWSTEQVIGYLYSTSVHSKRTLGDGVGDFEADVKRALLQTDTTERYTEIARFGCLSARSPDS